MIQCFDNSLLFSRIIPKTFVAFWGIKSTVIIALFYFIGVRKAFLPWLLQKSPAWHRNFTRPNKTTCMKYVTLLILGMLSSTGYSKTDTLQTVASVDLQKYAGKWYEIASKPIHWQRNCDCTAAEYTLRSDGKMDVLNSCNDRKKQKRDSARALATVVSGSNNAKLKVKFGIVTGDYEIIALARDYSYAMVGTRDRKHLWILNRTRIMDESIVKELVATAEKLGFNVEDLHFTKQSCYNNY